MAADSLRREVPTAALAASPRQRSDRPQPNLTAAGTTGTYLPAGIITGEEENVKLRWNLSRGGTSPTSAGEYHRMATQDPEIAGALRAITSVLLGAPVTVEPPPDADEQDEAASTLVQDAWDGLDGGPRRFQREAFTLLTYGFSLFETVHRRDEDGRILWSEFASRLQRTVQRWNVDPVTDRLTSVGFLAPFGGQSFKAYDLPASSLVLFSLDRTGNNFEGRSLLRAAYTYWICKKQAIRGTAIDVERAGHGFMLFAQDGEGAPPSDEDEARHAEIALNWRTNEAAHATVPAGWRLSFEFPDIPFAGRVEWLRYLDQQISKTFLATFMQLGMASAGTQALGDTLLDLFLRSLRALADTFEDAMNAAGGPVRQLVDLNFGPRKRYPRLRIGSLARDHAGQVLDRLKGGLDAGLFGKWTAADANVARELADLRPLAEEEAERIDEAGAAGAEPSAGSGGTPEVPTPPSPKALAEHPAAFSGTVVDGLGRSMKARRALLPDEECLALADIAALYDRGEETFESAARGPLDRGARKMAAAVRAIVYDDGLTAAERVSRMAALAFPEDAKAAVLTSVAAHLAGLAADAAEEGRGDVARQLRRGGTQPRQKAAKGTPGATVPVKIAVVRTPDAAALAEAQAEVVVGRMVSGVEASMRDAGARAARLGPEGAARALLDADTLVERWAESTFRAWATTAVNPVITEGRAEGAMEAFEAAGVEAVEQVQFSSVLDEGTCQPCATLDGTRFPYGSDEFYRTQPPYQDCDGRARNACRCIHILIGAVDSGEEE